MDHDAASPWNVPDVTDFLTQLLGQGEILGAQGATPSAMTTNTFRSNEGHLRPVPEGTGLMWLPQDSIPLRVPEMLTALQLPSNQVFSSFPVEQIKNLPAAQMNCGPTSRLINVPFELTHNGGAD